MLFETLNILARESESSLFSPDQFAGYAVTVVLTIINVIVAYFIIKFAIYKRILKMIHKRQEALNAELDEAAKSKAEADKVVAESKKTIDDAKSQAAQIIEEARENAYISLLGEQLDPCSEMRCRIEREIVPDPPLAQGRPRCMKMIRSNITGRSNGIGGIPRRICKR